MISKQVISKILNEHSYLILENYNVDDIKYFKDYEQEYLFIKEHYEKYGSVPDRESFIDKFPDFNIINVREPDSYLVRKLREDKLREDGVKVVYRIAELIEAGDIEGALDYGESAFGRVERSNTINSIDIFKEAKARLELFDNKVDNPESYFIPTGMAEIDSAIGGYERSEEFVIWAANTGKGKSWLLLNTTKQAALNGERIGFISPEMSGHKLGYRLDTLLSNESNSALVKGKKDYIDYNKYVEHIDWLSTKEGFFVSTPNDFDNKITPSKLKQYIKQNNLTMLVIDGILYLSNDGNSKMNSPALELETISQNLKSLSDEMKVPIICAHQMNKDNTTKSDIKNVAYSYGIVRSATKVFLIEQEDGKLDITLAKNRDDEDSKVFSYLWTIDKGIFKNISQTDNTGVKDDFIKLNKNKFGDGDTNVF